MDEIVFKQSPQQAMLCRLIKSGYAAFIGSLLPIGIAVFSDQPVGTLTWSLPIVLLSLPLVTTGWLKLFDSENSSGCCLTLSDDSISFKTNFWGESKIHWSNFKSFSIRKRFPYALVIESHCEDSINIEYYTFDKSQREAIIQFIEHKTQTVSNTVNS